MRSAARQARRRHLRHKLLQMSLLLAVAVVLVRAFQLQVLQTARWQDTAISQQNEKVDLPAPRGTIYDRSGRELVVSRTDYDVFVDPVELKDQPSATEALRRFANLDAKTARRIKETDKRVWIPIGRFSAVEKEQLEELVPRGLHPQAAIERFYPRGRLAAEIIGGVDIRGRGQSGLELTYDSLLTGQPGVGVRQRDANGASAGWLTIPKVAPSPGSDLYLTIDAEYQALAESVLEDAIVESAASGGDLLILEPKTGELLAAASRRNDQRFPTLTAATDPYEAGSTLKPFTAAALLAEDLASLGDSVDTGQGLYRFAGRTIRDGSPHGRLSLSQVLAVSSNVGMAKFAERLSAGVQYTYLRDFGFGTPTGLTYPSESGGLLRRPSEWSAQSKASVAIGYEVAVTPLQLAMAYGVLANGGLLMRPQLVREARFASGVVRWRREPEVIRRALTESVSSQLRAVLARAVTQGTGRSADLRGLSVAGKTGTAWRFDRRLGYGGNSYTSSFVGLIPSDDPKMVILVKLDAPSGPYYGGATAAPVMRTAVRAALAGSYWSAPPLLGEPDIPDEQAGVPAGQVPAGGPYVFALDTPLLRAADDVQSSEGTQSSAVPDLRGQTLRAAAQRLHQSGWRVVVRGGGRVVSTEPALGVRLRLGEPVVLVGNERGPPGQRHTKSGAR